MAYTVKKGDTFWKIAQELLGDGSKWKSLFVDGKSAGSYDPTKIQPGMVITTTADGSSDTGTTEGGENPAGAKTEALPRNAKLVKIGSSYRVIWDLGDGLGWAWYDIGKEQLKDLYKSETPTAHITLNNVGQFEAEYGNNHWGHISEVNLKAETPWEDLRDRIYNQFGWVPGFDDPQIKKMLIQAYFEDWDQNQWLVEYRKTDYYQNTTDKQRQWVGLSEAEKAAQIQEQKVDLANRYRSIWGSSIGIDNPDLINAAIKIASGQTDILSWEYNQRSAAAEQEGTPEWISRREAEEAARREGNEIEDLTLYAEKAWQSWVGPVDMPSDFAQKWGNNLADGTASQADLENYLKDISNGRWSYKPPNLTWEDWASTYKQQVKNTLELGSLDDGDPLLQQILSSDLTGVDLNQMIRQDERFKSTRTMYGELSSMAEDMGRRFGFIT